MNMLSEEYLIKTILSKRRDMTLEQLMEEVNRRMEQNPFLTRAGALLIILEEERLLEELETRQEDFTTTLIGNLKAGLKHLTVKGRVLGLRSLSPGERLAVLRIGDRTGAATVLLWDEHSELVKNMSPGQVVRLTDLAVSENRVTGALELTPSQNTVSETVEDDESIPPLASFFRTPSQIPWEDGRPHDVKCVLLFPWEWGSSKAGNPQHLVVGDGLTNYILRLWDIPALSPGEIKQGDVLLLTSVSKREDFLSSTSRTTLGRAEGEAELAEKALKSLQPERDLLVAYSDGLKTICVDETGPFIMVGPQNFSQNEVVRVFNSAAVSYRGRPRLFFQKAVPVKPENPPRIQAVQNLEERHLGRHDLILDCQLLRTGHVSEASTRYGVRPLASIWLRIGGSTYPATVWGETAYRMAEISEGSALRLYMATARRNRYGEVEIIVDDETGVVFRE